MKEISSFTNSSDYETVIKDIFNGDLNSTTTTVPSVEDGACDMNSQYLVDHLFVKLIFFLLYFIIFCLGFFGNILGKNQKVFLPLITSLL